MFEFIKKTNPVKKLRKRIKARRFNSRLKELELFTEVIPDGVIIINQNLVMEAVNESVQTLLGLPDNAVGKAIDDCVKSNALNGYLRSKSQTEPLEFTSPIQKDSTLELRVFSVDNGSKVLILRDITAQNRLLTMRQSRWRARIGDASILLIFLGEKKWENSMIKSP